MRLPGRGLDMKVFLNISNHPSMLWDEKQSKYARLLCDKNGDAKILDIKYPYISPSLDCDKAKDVAGGIIQRICDIKQGLAPCCAMVMGEFSSAHWIVDVLEEAGIKCYVSTTTRMAVNDNGNKLSGFSFVRFRRYFKANQEDFKRCGARLRNRIKTEII